MPKKIVPIVEGPGEEQAVAPLLRKLLSELSRFDILVDRPRNANGRGNLTKLGGIEKFIKIASSVQDCGAVFVLLDADEDCAKTLVQAIAARIIRAGTQHPVMIVVANREYEAWFLASLETIRGKDLKGRPGLPEDLDYDGDVETLVGVKGWISRHFSHGRAYKPAEDQAAMTALIDSNLAKTRSRSFCRLCHALEQAVHAIDQGHVLVTPEP